MRGAAGGRRSRSEPVFQTSPKNRATLVQQGEYPQRAARGDQVQIGHAAPEQRVSLAEVSTKHGRLNVA